MATAADQVAKSKYKFVVMNFLKKLVLAAVLVVANVAGLAASPAPTVSSAAQPKSFYTVQTITSIAAARPRYQRGEMLRVQVQAWVVRYDQIPGGWRVVRIRPSANTQVTLSEKSNVGTVHLARGLTDRNGSMFVSYRVPLDSRKDNVRLCGWAMNEEPFEGQEVRVPIGR